MPVELYTVEGAAQRLNTTPRFVRRLIAERRIAFTRLGRHVRISADDLEEFVLRGRVEAASRMPRRSGGGAS
jgi:excisionase family DNA binding protein